MLEKLIKKLRSIFIKEIKRNNQIYRHGDKIAQLIIQQAPDFTPVETENLDETSRGGNGFGSSGS